MKILTALSDFFSELSSMTALMSEDAINCITRLSALERFSPLSFLADIRKNSYEGCNLKDVWQKSFSESSEAVVLSGEIREKILSFSRVFGRCPMDEFTKKCNEYSDMAKQICYEEKKTAQQKYSLTAGMGILVAAAVFIIFI